MKIVAGGRQALAVLLMVYGAAWGAQASAASLGAPAAAPVTVEVPYEHKALGDVRQDPYFWLRGKEKPEVIKHLKAENSYLEKVMQPQKGLRKKLFGELKGHIKEEETSFPVQRNGFVYFSKMLKDREYPLHFRKAVAGSSTEQMILDENQLNPKGAYTRVAANVVSDDGQILAYALDTKGDRLYKVFFKDLSSGKMLSDTIENCTGDIVWAADNKTLFYVAYEPVTLRQRYVYRHVLGEKKDQLIFDEKDEKYTVELKRNLAKNFIFIEAHSKTSTEIHFLKASDPHLAPKLFHAREPGVEYELADGGDRFYIRTNWQAVNFRVMESTMESSGRDAWKEVIPHRADTLVEEILVLKNHLVLEGQRNGLAQIEVMERAGKKIEAIAFHDPAYSAWLEGNADYLAAELNFAYTSMTTPLTIIEYGLSAKTQKRKWQREVPGGFKPENYESLRLFATAGDGTKIPISLVFRKDRRTPGRPQPLLQYGYGSYGYSIHPVFNASRLTLLDRGFVFAIAHIRGGSEMGREWYLNGKFLKKKNTFSDFIACSEFLIKEGLTSSEMLFAQGMSAGGLLMGAVINLRPDLYRGVVAGVPFVDVLTTMLDATLPLTTEEYEEWGNPNDRTYYDYMKSYSPYDNVKAQSYPHILVTAGLHDTQVSYWEPAKWVARLRKMKTDNNPILFKIEMAAGHMGKNGRFASLELEALEQAFLLTLADRAK